MPTRRRTTRASPRNERCTPTTARPDTPLPPPTSPPTAPLLAADHPAVVATPFGNSRLPLARASRGYPRALVRCVRRSSRAHSPHEAPHCPGPATHSDASPCGNCSVLDHSVKHTVSRTESQTHGFGSLRPCGVRTVVHRCAEVACKSQDCCCDATPAAVTVDCINFGNHPEPPTKQWLLAGGLDSGWLLRGRCAGA